MVFLSVVVPCYNEEERIETTLRKIAQYLQQKSYAYEIIVVDDGSQDKTCALVKELIRDKADLHLLRQEQNRGKGLAVKKGMLRAKGEYVLFSDADNSTPIEEIERLFFWLKKGYDIAIGSRGLPESDVRKHQPWYRERMGKFFNLLVRLLILKDFRDTQCGFKCFKNKVVREIFPKQSINGFAFDVEILLLAKTHGYRIKEVPISWENSPQTKVGIIKGPVLMFLDLLKIKLRQF